MKIGNGSGTDKEKVFIKDDMYGYLHAHISPPSRKIYENRK